MKGGAVKTIEELEMWFRFSFERIRNVCGFKPEMVSIAEIADADICSRGPHSHR